MKEGLFMLEPLVTNIRVINLEDAMPYINHYVKLGVSKATFKIFCEDSSDVVVVNRTNMHPRAVRNRDEVFDFLERRG